MPNVDAAWSGAPMRAPGPPEHADARAGDRARADQRHGRPNGGQPYAGDVVSDGEAGAAAVEVLRIWRSSYVRRWLAAAGDANSRAAAVMGGCLPFARRTYSTPPRRSFHSPLNTLWRMRPSVTPSHGQRPCPWCPIRHPTAAIGNLRKCSVSAPQLRFARKAGDRQQCRSGTAPLRTLAAIVARCGRCWTICASTASGIVSCMAHPLVSINAIRIAQGLRQAHQASV